MRLIDVLAPAAWLVVTVYALVALGLLWGGLFSLFAALVFWREWHDLRKRESRPHSEE